MSYAHLDYRLYPNFRTVNSGIEKSHLKVKILVTPVFAVHRKCFFSLLCSGKFHSLPVLAAIDIRVSVFSFLYLGYREILLIKLLFALKENKQKSRSLLAHPCNRKHIYKIPSHPGSVGYHGHGGRWLQVCL